MLTTTSSELRSPRLSLMLRLVKWMVKLRRPIFPKQVSEVEPFLYQRTPPTDAAMPAGFTGRYAIERWMCADQEVVTLHPKAGPGAWHMLYFHGGGFVLPLVKEHWALIAAMIDTCGISVSVPLFHLVPEHSHHAQDAVADAAFAKLAESHDPAKIILNGDSAGGHMALSLALRLARAGGAQPGKLALFAPWLDVTLQDAAMRAIEPHDIMLRVDSLRVLGRIWAGERDPASAECSPLFTPLEELALLPPTRIWTGRHDLFIVDSRSFVAKLRAAGVDAKLYEYEAAPHVFMAITPTREAKDVFALLRDFIAG
jgi:acetyl esterase/lipase